MSSLTPSIENYDTSTSIDVDLGYNTHVVTLDSGIIVTLNLPDLASFGDGTTVRFKRNDNMNSTLTIISTGGVIYPSGTSSIDISGLTELNLVSQGLNWYVISDEETGSFLSTQHLFVDSIVGDDGTAEVNNPVKPWKTITAAVIASAPLLGSGNYLIYVRAGEYLTESNLLISNPIGRQRFYFEEGAVVQTSSGVLFLGEKEININAEITGYGVFQSSDNYIIYNHATGYFYFEAFKLINHNFNNYIINATLTIKVNEIIGSTGSGPFLINSNFEMDSITVPETGLLLNTCDGKVGIIEADTGLYIINDINVEISQINSITTGIIIQSSGTINLNIGTITGTNGILISLNSVDVILTGSINNLSSYINQNNFTVIDTLKIGTITSGITLSGSGTYTSNWDINSVSGGLTVSGSGSRNLVATIQSLSGGYINVGTGILTENLTFGSVDGFITFERSSGVVDCNWIINSINSGNNSAISITNTGDTGTFNIQVNSIIGNRINFTGSQSYIGNLNINSIESDIGITFNTAGSSKFTVIGNTFHVTQTGIVISNSDSLDLTLNINSISGGINGISIENLSAGNLQLTGSVKEITVSGSGYYNQGINNVTETLNFGSIDSNTGINYNRNSGLIQSNLKIGRIQSNTGIIITYPESDSIINLEIQEIIADQIGIDISGDLIVNGSINSIRILDPNVNSRGLRLNRITTKSSNLKFGSIIMSDTSTAIESINGVNLISGSEIISSSGATMSNGILISGGQLNINVDYIQQTLVGFLINGGFSNSKRGHRIYVKIVDAENQAVLVGGENYVPNFLLNGGFVTRNTVPALQLNGINVLGDDVAAVLITAGTVFQAKDNTICIDSPATVSILTLLGSTLFSPNLPPHISTNLQNPGFGIISSDSWY